MAANNSPAKEGPRRLEVYVHWTEHSGWVFVPRPSNRPEGDPGLSIEAPATEPPAGTQGRYILLDRRVLSPALDGAFQAMGPDAGSGSRSAEGGRSPATAARRQDFPFRGLEPSMRQLEACPDKIRPKLSQHAGMAPLKAVLEETKARLEAEISRADMEKLRADQIQEELNRREQATRQELQLTGERFAARFQENVNARRELESWEIDIKKARVQLEAAAEDLRLKRARFLQEVSQTREEQERLARMRSSEQEERMTGELEKLAGDRVALENERQCHMDQIRAERTRLETEQKERLKGLNDESEKLARDRVALENEHQSHMDQIRVDRMRLEADQKRYAEESTKSQEHQEQAASMQLEVEQERARLTDGRRRLTQERERMEEGREQVNHEREWLAERRQKLTHESEQLAEGREQLAQEREQLTEGREQLTQEREQLAEGREQLTKEREQLVRGREALAKGQELLSEEQGKVAESLKLKQDQQPGNLFRLLEDSFMASRPESNFLSADEHLVEDAKRSKDASVVKEQFRMLDASLAHKPDGERRESGSLRGAAEPADSVSSASTGIVGALLAIQGLQEAGEKKLASELQEQLGFKASKAMNLGSAGIHGKARTHEEKAALRRETPLAFAFALVSVCCLLWSSARRRMQGTIVSIRKEVQELRQALPSLEGDLGRLQERLRGIFAACSPAAALGEAHAQCLKEQTSVVEAIEDLKKRFRSYSKSDCVGKMVEVSSKCYQAWEMFEKHMVWQRRFGHLRRHGTPGSGDLRAFLLASLQDPDEEGASLPRDLAAVVRHAACQRQTGLAGLQSPCKGGEAGAVTTPTRPPSKRARHSISPASPFPAMSPDSSHMPAGGRAEASEEHASTPQPLG